jgi:hypothetical protein
MATGKTTNSTRRNDTAGCGSLIDQFLPPQHAAITSAGLE